jgi:cytochrome c peroxidase
MRRNLGVGGCLALGVAVVVGGSCDTPEASVALPDEGLDEVAAVLNLDLTNPPNYAEPSFPSHYGPGTLNDDNAPAGNPVTDEGASLGRVLFYDPALSLNATTSCASCHIQSLGFTDDQQFSAGFAGGETAAHSMRLANANFFEGREMFWDRRAADLEDQVLQPVLDPVEMGFDEGAGGVTALIERLGNSSYYPPLFEWAFGTDEITETRLRLALAQYVRSIVSTDSRFDQGRALAGNTGPGPIGPLPNLTAQENLGLQLFTTPPVGCAGCHQLPSFALDDDNRGNGLDAGETTVFKAPSLKNVAVAGPYMHDGRFATLEEVVEHYDSGVQNGPALDRRLMGPNGAPIRLNLTEDERAALVAFMRTLTDEALLVDPRFSDPFIR